MSNDDNDSLRTILRVALADLDDNDLLTRLRWHVQSGHSLLVDITVAEVATRLQRLRDKADNAELLRQMEPNMPCKACREILARRRMPPGEHMDDGN